MNAIEKSFDFGGVSKASPTVKEIQFAFPNVRHGGYIYIVLFHNGVLKAGRTKKPATRIQNHASDAASFGSGIEQVWVSHPHDNYTSNESELLAKLSQIATQQNKREYFEGVQFQDAVSLTENLVFDEVDVAAHEARAAESAEKMKNLLRIDLPETEQANPVLAWGAPIKNMFRQIRQLPDLDQPEQDIEGMHEAWEASAAAMGRPYEEVIAMSYLDVMEHIAATMVRSAFLDTKIWALQNNRCDLTDSMGERYGA